MSKNRFQNQESQEQNPTEECAEITVQESSQVVAPQVTSEPTHELSVLKSNARVLFGVEPEVLVGAFYQNPKDKFTKQEAEQIIREFLQREAN